MDHPTPDALQRLLKDLLGVGVTVRAGGCPTGPTGLAGYYADSTGKVTAAAWFEQVLAAYAGAALSMIDADQAKAATGGDQLPDNLVENANEVLNVVSALLHGDSHVKLGGTTQTPPAPSEVATLLGRPTDQLWFTVDVEGYGAGVAMFTIARARVEVDEFA